MIKEIGKIAAQMKAGPHKEALLEVLKTASNQNVLITVGCKDHSP